MSHAARYLRQTAAIAEALDGAALDRLALALAELRRQGGRLFCLGVGGGAAHASHAVNDFRKLCGIEAYAPTDNVAELIARTNDEAWDSAFAGWLAVSRAGPADALFVFSVGGGDAARGVSANLVRAIDWAKARGLRVFGIVGRDGGHTARAGDLVVVVPTVDPALVTPHTEGFQAVLWHCLVSHPALAQAPAKWESLAGMEAAPS